MNAVDADPAHAARGLAILSENSAPEAKSDDASSDVIAPEAFDRQNLLITTDPAITAHNLKKEDSSIIAYTASNSRNGSSSYTASTAKDAQYAATRTRPKDVESLDFKSHAAKREGDTITVDTLNLEHVPASYHPRIRTMLRQFEDMFVHIRLIREMRDIYMLRVG